MAFHKLHAIASISLTFHCRRRIERQDERNFQRAIAKISTDFRTNRTTNCSEFEVIISLESFFIVSLLIYRSEIPVTLHFAY